MIKLTGFNNKEFYLNCDLIEKIEVTPDSVIESSDDIINKIIEFKKRYMAIPEVIKEWKNATYQLH